MPYPHWAKTGKNGQKRAKTGANRRKLLSGDGVKTGENGQKLTKTGEKFFGMPKIFSPIFASFRQSMKSHETHFTKTGMKTGKTHPHQNFARFRLFLPVFAQWG